MMEDRSWEGERKRERVVSLPSLLNVGISINICDGLCRYRNVPRESNNSFLCNTDEDKGLTTYQQNLH